MNQIPVFEIATVKVMRSHDYCHFEVSLSSSADTTQEVDYLRKTAARLVDKAVEQYKVAKLNAERIDSDRYTVAGIVRRVSEIEKIPESERSPREKAILKKAADWAHHKRRAYDYEDDWQEDPDLDDSLPADDEDVSF